MDPLTFFAPLLIRSSPMAALRPWRDAMGLVGQGEFPSQQEVFDDLLGRQSLACQECGPYSVRRTEAPAPGAMGQITQFTASCLFLAECP